MPILVSLALIVSEI